MALFLAAFLQAKSNHQKLTEIIQFVHLLQPQRAAAAAAIMVAPVILQLATADLVAGGTDIILEPVPGYPGKATMVQTMDQQAAAGAAARGKLAKAAWAETD